MHGIFLLALAGGVHDLHRSGAKLLLAADRRAGCHGIVYESRDCMEEEIHKQRGCAPISWQLGLRLLLIESRWLSSASASTRQHTKLENIYHVHS